MLKVLLSVLFILTLVTSNSSSEETQNLGRITVTPSRLKGPPGAAARSETVLGSEAFRDFDYAAIADGLAVLGGIDIRRRGPEGVQADVNIRGTTFEQNSVLIDGVKVNDPQTGHFNMDLPVTAADVDRVEVLKGPASSLYGANSFGGVINIITKRPDKTAVIVDAQGGSFDYFQGGLSASVALGMLKNRFSIEDARSSGYMPETEFNILSLADSATLETLFGIYNFLFGYSKKDFGADSFYSNLYPNEEEHTDTRFFKLDGAIEAGVLKIQPKVFLRRHKDHFSLDRNRPGWQTNYHTAYSYGGEITFALENRFLDAAYGYALTRDTIDSTNIQTHARTNSGMYVEVSPHILDDLYVNIGFREDYFSGFGWEYSPSASASYPLFKALNIRFLIGRSYRIPTFTDLYYIDRANIGNADLRPESSWTYEAGADYTAGPVNLSADYFHRDSYDTIDWMRMDAKDSWRASNIGSVRTNGFELSIELMPKKLYKGSPVEKAFFNYTVLDEYAKHDYLSKYALDYLKQQICASFEWAVCGFKNNWVLNYKKRIGDSGYIVVDTSVSKEIVRKASVSFEAFLDISNIFDASYSEQSGVPMPGRWIKSGARLRF